jgi:hypothetical protein
MTNDESSSNQKMTDSDRDACRCSSNSEFFRHLTFVIRHCLNVHAPCRAEQISFLLEGIIERLLQIKIHHGIAQARIVCRIQNFGIL